MDQAFVKAFARRNRLERIQPDGAPTAASPTVDTAADRDRPVEQAASSADEPGSLQVDRSVASTAKVWVDPIEDQIARADQAASQVPKPHVDSPAEPAPEPIAEPEEDAEVAPAAEPTAPPSPPADRPEVDPWQHVHTAYATAVAGPAVGSTETAGVTEPFDVQPADATAATAPTVAEVSTHTPPQEQVSGDRQPITLPVTKTRIDPPETQAGGPRAIVPFQAVWEVDVFDVPKLIADLFFEGNLFQQIAERMSDAVSGGLGSILITSTKAGEGRSSVAIGIAMAAAASGIRVALVDADTEAPTLADDLRLELQYGWVDTIRGGLPIKEVAVHAVEDGVTLIPLMPPHGQTAATAFEVVQLIDLLKNKFELVIIDGPTGRWPGIHQCASTVDSAIIVRDVSRTNTLSLNELSYRLRESGVKGIGVVENYV